MNNVAFTGIPVSNLFCFFFFCFLLINIWALANQEENKNSKIKQIARDSK